MENATFAAGCFWGVEYKLARVPGVTQAAVGYMGGAVDTPSYEQVCTGTTGHAEVAQVTFDPGQVSFEALVRAFYALHDPTQKDRQGPDTGTQYRSAIFFHDESQREAADRVTAELNGSTFGGRIVTQIVPAQTFWRAEEYHQQYGDKHPGHHCTL